MKIETSFNQTNNSSLENKSQKSTTSFKDVLLGDFEDLSEDFSFETIQKIPLNKIEDIYQTEHNIKKAKNLKIATMFTEDKSLSKALYEQVLNKQASNKDEEYLFDMIQDKIIFLSSDSTTLESLLQKSVESRVDLSSNEKILQRVTPSEINAVLSYVNAINFISSMGNTYESLNNRYLNKDDKYSIFYNNHYLEYHFLIAKFKEYDRQIEKLSQL
ncbi:hypothetical protein [Arcobacter sp. CECT 8985]|uniref:hypothetical protein n=1 Tax=Arcobacter sp. CECT 8985 TaxID=1935424 RepID=UPI00100B17C6|nr:hypothetical protein [Arcobacter sp. CECT 8985]RXJ86531.1 hypothetical protein CRU93_08295 [Arcobacter sp. CECT 8985]